MLILTLVAPPFGQLSDVSAADAALLKLKGDLAALKTLSPMLEREFAENTQRIHKEYTNAVSQAVDEVFTEPQVIAQAQKWYKHVLPSPALIKYDDKQYIDRVARRSVFEMRLAVGYLAQFGFRDANTIQQISREARELADGVAKLLQRHLSRDNMFPSDNDVTLVVGRMQRRLLEYLNDPISMYLTQPVGNDEIQRMLDSYEKRLLENKLRILNAFEANSEKTPADAEQIAALSNLLEELLVPINREFVKRSTNPNRKDFNVEAVVPGYTQLIRELVSIELELSNKKGDASSSRPPAGP
jgi:hypothetical protein